MYVHVKIIIASINENSACSIKARNKCLIKESDTVVMGQLTNTEEYLIILWGDISIKLITIKL